MPKKIVKQNEAYKIKREQKLLQMHCP